MERSMREESCLVFDTIVKMVETIYWNRVFLNSGSIVRLGHDYTADARVSTSNDSTTDAF